MNFSRYASQTRRQAQRLTSPTPRILEPKLSPQESDMDEQIGESSPDYQARVESYLKRADIKANARAAKPTPSTPPENAVELGAEDQIGSLQSRAPGH